MYEQREIVLIPFPYSDLTGFKQRPAIIISNKNINSFDDRICCLITSKKPKEGMLISSTSLEIGKLPFKSWIKPERIFTIDKKIIRKKLCKVNVNFHKKLVDSISVLIK